MNDPNQGQNQGQPQAAPVQAPPVLPAPAQAQPAPPQPAAPLLPPPAAPAAPPFALAPWRNDHILDWTNPAHQAILQGNVSSRLDREVRWTTQQDSLILSSH